LFERKIENFIRHNGFTTNQFYTKVRRELATRPTAGSKGSTPVRSECKDHASSDSKEERAGDQQTHDDDATSVLTQQAESRRMCKKMSGSTKANPSDSETLLRYLNEAADFATWAENMRVSAHIHYWAEDEQLNSFKGK
jgi:hypothetical protein